MSSLISPELIDPRTMEAIKGLRPHRPATIGDSYPCGCHPRRDRWYLCDYHEGYDDALDIHS